MSFLCQRAQVAQLQNTPFVCYNPGVDTYVVVDAYQQSYYYTSSIQRYKKP